MEEFDELNSPILIKKTDGTIIEQLNCLDCIRLRAKLDKFQSEKNPDKKMFLPLSNIDIDLEKMSASFRSKGKGNMQVQKISPQNRIRSANSKRADGLVFRTSDEMLDLPKSNFAFARAYSTQVK